MTTTAHSVTYEKFTIERTYAAQRARVWAALADPATKAQWFGAPGTEERVTMDFREGGIEVREGEHQGNTYRFEARYVDIVDQERIVNSYDMFYGGTKLSVSISSYELADAGDSTRLTFTESMAVFDGKETLESRRSGTESILDALAQFLQGQR